MSFKRQGNGRYSSGRAGGRLVLDGMDQDAWLQIAVREDGLATREMDKSILASLDGGFYGQRLIDVFGRKSVI